VSDKPKRRWYQFNLLALFVLTTLVAAVLAYVTYEQRLAQNQKSAAEELQKLDGVHFRLFYGRDSVSPVAAARARR
jgi:cell division protein FtsL